MRRNVILLVCAAFSQPTTLQFDDYPATEAWNGANAPVQLRTASEQMFKTNLTNAAKEKPDFAGHYKFAGWGCGSVCAAGAIIDLHTGLVYPPPGKSGSERGWSRWIFAGGHVSGRYAERSRDSRLIIVRNQPDTRAYVWEKDHFRPIPLRLAKQPVER